MATISDKSIAASARRGGLLALGILVARTAFAAITIGSPVITPWRDNAASAYSIVHDDTCDFSTPGINANWQEVLPRGVKLAWAAIGAQCPQTAGSIAMLNAMVEAGQEVASHSMKHCRHTLASCAAYPSLDTNAYRTEEMLGSRNYFQSILPAGTTVSFYAFPFDASNTTLLTQLQGFGYLGARGGVRPDVGGHPVNTADIDPLTDSLVDFRVQFDAYDADDSGGNSSTYLGPFPAPTFTSLTAYLDDVVSLGGWGVQELHGIGDASYGNVSLATYRVHLDDLVTRQANRQAWVAPPTEVIKYRRSRYHCGPITRSGAVLTFTGAGNADCQTYATTVTVKIPVSSGENVIAAMQGTAPDEKWLTVRADGSGDFFVDANPLDGPITVVDAAAPAITSGDSATFTVGAVSNFTVTATGARSPVLTSSTPPAGVAFVPTTGTPASPATTVVLGGVPTAAGTYTLTFTAANDVTPSATQTFTLTVAKAAQSIIFGTLSSAQLGAAPRTVSATGGPSTSPVTFAASGSCSSGGVNGATITMSTLGTCTVVASQLGDANYLEAAPVTRTFEVVDTPPALAFGALNAITNANLAAYGFTGACEAGGSSVGYTLLSGGSLNGTVNCVSGAFAVAGLNASALADSLSVAFTITQVDAFGNTWTATASAVKDTLNPSLNIDAPPPINGENQGVYAVAGNCSEQGRTVTATVGPAGGVGPVTASAVCGASVGGRYQATGIVVPRLMPEGSVPVSASMTDAVGNSATATATAVKDTTPDVVLVSDINPATTDQTVTLTATLSDYSQINPPTGTVAFRIGGMPIAGCGSRAINSGGIYALCFFSPGVGGAYAISAEYSGDAGYHAATSGVMNQVVEIAIGPPTQIAVNAGNNQTATVGTAVAIAPSVVVRDANSNPVAGIPVTFAVTAGGGSVSDGTQTTNASGIATVGSWTLGATAGTNNNTLTATSAGLAGSPLPFTASAIAPPTIVRPTSSAAGTTSVTLGGTVDSDGGSTITQRGVVYSLTSANSNPVIGGSGVTPVTVSGTAGVFTTGITGLMPGTGYSFKAYATNLVGTSYTSMATFTTTALLPTSQTVCPSGCDKTKIQDAINGSAPGGSILVKSTYDSIAAGEVFPIQTLAINQTGSITISGEKDGAGNPITTVKTKSGPVDGFSIVSPGSVIKDLKIIPGDGTKVNRVITASRNPGSCPGASCHLQGLTIKNVVIDFSATFNTGSGIDLLADNVVIDGVTIKGIAGTSILVDGNNNTVQNSTLDGHDGATIRGALAIGFGADQRVSGVACSGVPTTYVVNGNSLAGYANGISWCSGQNTTVSNNTITDISGKGIFSSGSQGTQIFGNVLQNNVAAVYGIGLSSNASQTCVGNTVRNNKVLGRAARDMQQGIVVQSCLETTIFQNEVRDFADSGGAVYVTMTAGVATKTTIQGNTVIGGDGPGIVYLGADSGATAVDQSVIRDNVVNEFKKNGIVVQFIKGPRSGAGAGNVVAYNTVRAVNQGTFPDTHAFNLQNLANTAFDRNTALDTKGTGYGFFLANSTGVNGNCNAGSTNGGGLFAQVNVTPTYGNANVNCRVALYSHYDFDGDGKSDVTMYRHTTGEWFVRNSSNGADSVMSFGAPGSDDIPAPGNYTTPGKTDMAIYRYTTGEWLIRRATDGETTVIPFGSPLVGDVPMPADYDGDGITDLAVFRTSTANAEWYVRRSSDGQTQYAAWGCAACADLGVPGDYDGDGKADVAVYRRSTGEWFIRKSTDTTLQQVPFGLPAQGDIPVPGRYTQSTRTDMAVYRSLTGDWLIRRSTDFGTTTVNFGVPSAGDFPVPANFSQSGITDIAIYRPTPPTAQFMIRRSTNLTTSVFPYGDPASQDAPLTAR